jgi:aryl sulfotransferase
MKAQGAALLPGMERAFRGGHDTFLHRGTNERWRDVLNEDDVALYEARAAASLSPGLRRWLEAGRLKAGDPRRSGD